MSFKFTADYAGLRKPTLHGSLTAAPKYSSKRRSDVGRDGSLGVAIRYEQERLGIESRWGQRFSAPVPDRPLG